MKITIDKETCIKAVMTEVLEKLAAAEHDQWIHWSKNICHEEAISPGRIDRWAQYWVPYENLSDDVKEYDREWARVALDIFIEAFFPESFEVEV